MSDQPTKTAGRGMTCGSQTYWYEDGVQRGRFCGRPAARVTRALDGSLNHSCDEHADACVEAGAREVPDHASQAGR